MAEKKKTKPRTLKALAPSLYAQGSAVAPAAAAAIATLAAPAAGTYHLRIRAGYGGTADVINNMDLRRGGVVLKTLFVPAVAQGDRETELTVVLNGAQNLTVNAVALGGAGSVFNAEIVATRVEAV